jgi:hypothetical protein
MLRGRVRQIDRLFDLGVVQSEHSGRPTPVGVCGVPRAVPAGGVPRAPLQCVSRSDVSDRYTRGVITFQHSRPHFSGQNGSIIVALGSRRVASR